MISVLLKPAISVIDFNRRVEKVLIIFFQFKKRKKLEINALIFNIQSKNEKEKVLTILKTNKKNVLNVSQVNVYVMLGCALRRLRKNCAI